MSEPLAVIREFPNELEAQLAQSVLKANDIPSEILRDDAGGMIPALHMMFPLRLLVRATDAERAIEILDSSYDDNQATSGDTDG